MWPSQTTMCNLFRWLSKVSVIFYYNRCVQNIFTAVNNTRKHLSVGEDFPVEDKILRNCTPGRGFSGVEDFLPHWPMASDTNSWLYAVQYRIIFTPLTASKMKSGTSSIAEWQETHQSFGELQTNRLYRHTRIKCTCNNKTAVLKM